MKSLVRKGKVLTQVAALPFRRTEAGDIELMLITSRETRRFVLPKGWPMKGKSDGEAAAEEALEEAGVVGSHGEKPLGSFQYWKRLNKVFVPITVDVYPLEVETVLLKWREKSDRQRAWVTLSQAELLVDEPELMSLFKAAGEQ